MSYHTRDREVLCAECHDRVILERKERAHRSLRERRSKKPVDRQKVLNLAIAAAIVLVVGGFIFLMSNQGGDVVATNNMQQENAAQAAAEN